MAGRRYTSRVLSVGFGSAWDKNGRYAAGIGLGIPQEHGSCLL